MNAAYVLIATLAFLTFPIMGMNDCNEGETTRFERSIESELEEAQWDLPTIGIVPRLNLAARIRNLRRERDSFEQRTVESEQHAADLEREVAELRARVAQMEAAGSPVSNSDPVSDEAADDTSSSSGVISQPKVSSSGRASGNSAASPQKTVSRKPKNKGDLYDRLNTKDVGQKRTGKIFKRPEVGMPATSPFKKK